MLVGGLVGGTVVVGGGGCVGGTVVGGGGVRFVRCGGLVCRAVLDGGPTSCETRPEEVTVVRGVVVAAVESGEWCCVPAIVGAWTMLRLGPGPSAMPREVGGDASRRGINAPPATATASSSAATKRSFRLMFTPYPADNNP